MTSAALAHPLLLALPAGDRAECDSADRERAAASDPEHELERLHGVAFAWAALCVGGDGDAAAEVLQAAYLRVLDGRARFASRSSRKTFLFAVIRHVAQAQQRRQRLLRLLLLRRAPELRTGVAEAQPIESVLAAERAAHVRAVLGALSLRQREVMELVFYHDFTLDQAAAVLGVSPGTARSHYERGKQELRRRLDLEQRP